MESLVVGSTSVIGRAIVADLNSIGSVSTAGRRDADVHLDLSVTDPLPVIDQCFDAVVLVAADFGGPRDEDLVRATQVNVLGSITAARIAAHVGAEHVVLISSISASYRPGDSYYNAYALTKAQSEAAVSFYCSERGIELSIVRPSGVFDSHGRCRPHQRLLYGIVDSARAGADFTIAGSADPLRNYVHVSDVAALVRSLVSRTEAGTFVCAQRESLSISAIANHAFAVFGNGGRVRFDPLQPDIVELPPITQPAGSTTWAPSISIEEGLCEIRDHEERTA